MFCSTFQVLKWMVQSPRARMVWMCHALPIQRDWNWSCHSFLRSSLGCVNPLFCEFLRDPGAAHKVGTSGVVVITWGRFGGCWCCNCGCICSCCCSWNCCDRQFIIGKRSARSRLIWYSIALPAVRSIKEIKRVPTYLILILPS